MPAVPPELLVIPPLAVAAGIDLYLTLLFLGASPTIGLWERPLPGALGDLDSPGIMIVVGAIYLLEFAAERHPPTALVWNAFHAVIRPVSGMLLALLILDGQPTTVVVVGCIAAGVLSSAAHAVRSGRAVQRWLGGITVPSVLLVSLFEDVLVLGIVALTLDLPAVALATTAALAVPLGWRAGSDVRAFAFAVRLGIARIFQTLTRRRWWGPDELPEWVRASLEDDDALAPGGALRGSPVAALGLPTTPRFTFGWVLVRGGPPVLVYRRRRVVHRLGLGRFDEAQVVERGFFRRVDMRGQDQAQAKLFFSLNGPTASSLRAEFVGA